MPKLTTTSYAILGLLNLRPYSAYELAQQSERSLRFVWPTAPSRLYAEPKRLAAEGLIEVVEEPAGPTRTRQVFRITGAGRSALRAWLQTEPEAPRIEMEVLLRTLLADAGEPADLLEALDRTREQTAELYGIGMAMLEGYAAGDVPFPERMHLNMLWSVFVRDLLQLVQDWTAFAEDEVRGWHAAADRGRTRRADELLTALLAGDAIVPRGTATAGSVDVGGERERR